MNEHRSSFLLALLKHLMLSGHEVFEMPSSGLLAEVNSRYTIESTTVDGVTTLRLIDSLRTSGILFKDVQDTVEAKQYLELRSPSSLN